MKFKKFLSLCVVIAAFSLAACTGTQSSSKASSSSGTSVASSQQSSQASSSKSSSSVALSSSSAKSSSSSSVASSSSSVASSSAAAAITPNVNNEFSLPLTNAVAEGMVTSDGKSVKGGYATWNLANVVAGNYDFYITLQYGSGGGSQLLSVRQLKFVINSNSIDPSKNAMTAIEAGVPAALGEASLSVVALPAGNVEFKFGCTLDANYRFTFDLSVPARLVPVVA